MWQAITSESHLIAIKDMYDRAGILRRDGMRTGLNHGRYLECPSWNEACAAIFKASTQFSLIEEPRIFAVLKLLPNYSSPLFCCVANIVLRGRLERNAGAGVCEGEGQRHAIDSWGSHCWPLWFCSAWHNEKQNWVELTTAGWCILTLLKGICHLKRWVKVL